MKQTDEITTLKPGVEGASPTVLKVGSDPRRVPGYYLDDYGKPPAPDDPLLRRSSVCKPKYVVYECGCGRHIVPSTCMSRECITCAPYVGHKRSQSVYERFEHRSGSKAVIYTIFTVPKHIRERYRDNKEWSKLRGKIWTVLKNRFGGLFSVEVTHPIGEDGRRFHPHLNYLWIQRNGWKPYINVDFLRTEWAAILGVDVVDVETQYSGNEAQVRHWCNYVTRTFPGYHWWTGPIRWFGKYPKHCKHQMHLCPQCGEELRLIGTLDMQAVQEYYETGITIGRDPPWYRDDCIIHFKKKGRKENETTADNGAAINVGFEEPELYARRSLEDYPGYTRTSV